MMGNAVCLGFGYCAKVFAGRLAQRGWGVVGTNRRGCDGAIAFDGEATPALVAALASAEAVLISIPPDVDGRDPAMAAVDQAALRPGCWIGYLSTTGVYGDRDGGWVDEDSAVLSAEPRSRARNGAESAWRMRGAHIFRLAGIYGPGRSPLDRVRAGESRSVVKPGQVFSRIHVDDIARMLLASLDRPNPGRIYNVCDDAPAPPQDVAAFAASLLGLPAPHLIPYEAAGLSGMAASFYSENKRVSNARAKAELGWRPVYPSYREGLAALLAD